ncbi:hypothetical protein T484DRAFT_1831715 [Baffinella frigidus]|nr:hypothetical protein T484DRAFT_1831715 [Cryptophyta sp. CCMP2293]
MSPPGGYTAAAKGSAVLVFLPGTQEIAAVQTALRNTRELGSSDEQREWVMQLHGSLPPDEQRRVFIRPPAGIIKRRVFLRPPAGIIKVVLATNVAETSVTIDDVGVGTPLTPSVCLYL